MTARPIRRLIATLSLVMLPLMASAQPAKIYLDRVPGTCSDLNFRWYTTGVCGLLGCHEWWWAVTDYVLMINLRSIQEHIARKFIDLRPSFSTQRFTRQDPSGPLSCLRASNFDFRFSARTSITRLHWEPLFQPCQPCENEWTNHVWSVDSHERKHLSHIMAALETANSQWPQFPPTRVIEVCGPSAGIISNLQTKLETEVGAQLGETFKRLDYQVKADGEALDRREPYGPFNCSACRCEVPAECKTVTVGPDKMRGGAPASGDVTLLSAAPPGGADVLLKSDNPAASVVSQLNVPEGAINQTFGITLTPVQQITKGFVHATRPGAGKICSVELWVHPPELVGLVTPSRMTGGTTEKGTVTLGTVAPAGGIEVQLSGDTYLGVPNPVVVPAGALEAKFDIDAKVRGRPGYSSQRVTADWLGTKITKWTEVY